MQNKEEMIYMTKFYEFSQNNSGGDFVVDDKVCHRLFIEADSVHEANEIAEQLGCYWNGVSKGYDCECCGDRWSTAWGHVDLEKFSEKGYEVSVSDHYENPEERWWNKYGKYTIIEQPYWETKYFRSFKGKIAFNNIEEYAQFLADEYGWTIPDARIYYKDGTVKEIFIN
jgi:hypothetical protein